MGAPIPDGRSGGPNDVAFTIPAEGGDNAITVSMRLLRGLSAVAKACALWCYLSSDAAGQTLSAAPDTLAGGTDGTVLIEATANLVFLVVFEADGHADIDIGKAGAAVYYLNVIMPDGTVKTSGAITFEA